MSYQPVPVKTFGALNLVADPADVGLGQFVTGKNFDTIDSGRVRARDGYGSYLSYANVQTLKRFGQFVFASSFTANTSWRIDTSAGTGAAIATGASTDASWDFASNGISGFVYSCAPNRTLRRVAAGSGSLGSPLTGTPPGSLMTTTPIDDRLVVVDPAHPSQVQFSAAGDGTTWGANDYVYLAPGDGGIVQAFATYGNDLYVFKDDKFFVFTGESVDASGQPVFNYRTIDTGKHLVCYRAAVGTPYGVFFVASDGVYVTTGGPPQLVSEPVSPLFDRQMATDFDYQLLDTSNPSRQPPLFTTAGGVYITYHQDRVYINFGTTGTRTLVFDPRAQTWHYWQFADDVFSLLGDVPQAGSPGQTQLLIAGSAALYKQVGSETTDNGTTITSRVVSGSADFGLDGYKAVRETELRGSGSPSFGVFTDRDYTTGTTAVSFNAERRGKYRIAKRGEQFAWSATGTSAWGLDSLTLQLRDRRAPGTGDVN